MLTLSGRCEGRRVVQATEDVHVGIASLLRVTWSNIYHGPGEEDGQDCLADELIGWVLKFEGCGLAKRSR